LASLRKQLKFNVETKNLDVALVTISSLATRLDRMHHLFSEFRGLIVELENDLNNIEINIINVDEDSNDVQQNLGRQEEGSGAQAGGVSGSSQSEHKEAQAHESERPRQADD